MKLCLLGRTTVANFQSQDRNCCSVSFSDPPEFRALKLEILRSENANSMLKIEDSALRRCQFCTQKTILNRPPRILRSGNYYYYSAFICAVYLKWFKGATYVQPTNLGNGNSTHKNGNSALGKWKIFPKPSKVDFFMIFPRQIGQFCAISCYHISVEIPH